MKHSATWIIVGFLSSQMVGASASSKLTGAQADELMAMIHVINHSTSPYKTTVMQQMLAEANYFSDKLELPTKHPLQITDIQDRFIASPWLSVIHGTNYPYFPVTIFGRDICNTNIPREVRLQSLKIGTFGRIDTTNFEFGFDQGKLLHVMRLSASSVEYYANNLDALIGKPSLIDTNGAYQLAKQWLAAVDVDMTALNKLKWTVNQLHYLARGASNAVDLPLYYVDFGARHHPASGNLKAFDEPLVSVEILGTAKELQDLMINDLSYSRRPLLLITNALDLVRTPNPSVKQLQNPATARAYALTPTQVSNYTKNFPPPPAQTNSVLPSVQPK